MHDITQNVMAQSRSINESMASLNMPPRKNMPMTTPQPTPLGQPMSQVKWRTFRQSNDIIGFGEYAHFVSAERENLLIGFIARFAPL